ncbi:MAG TPA: TniQ family protein [Oligoflexus sp.]|uniref:TniQ family protein n=1 Tax=Oligoflexus sp. TaxID=1971216 RepID=UPI002D7FBB39|nr:TniQ family protein [Oligoflexus sp.]HET9239232.1 TniQ family protein [Oligoflexus sp.]
MSEGWPLHPTPYDHELLSQWIRRIAKVYGVSYYDFCQRVLGLDRIERLHLDYQPSEKTLDILSKGTRQPIELLRERNVTAQSHLIEKELEKGGSGDPELIWKITKNLAGEGWPLPI